MKVLTRLLALTCTILLPCVSYADFKLCQFAGNFISYSSSAGGNTIADANNAALTSVGQIRLNRNGTGVVNFLNFNTFFSSAVHTSSDLTDLPVTFTLENAVLGIGRLTVFNFPTPGSDINTTFVATKERRSLRGKSLVTGLVLNVNTFSGSAPSPSHNASLIFVNRQ